MLQTILDALSPGWVGTTVSLVALVIGVGLAIWGIVVSSKRPRPAVMRLNRRLLGGPTQMLPKNIQILFDGKEVPHIMRTLVWVWNAGNATLRGEDIVAKDQLRLEYNAKTQVLSVRVLKVTRSVLGFTATIGEDTSRVFVNFDYLDGKDGALIEILHTGKGSPAFLGTIRGVPSIRSVGTNKGVMSMIKDGMIGPSPSAGMTLIIFGAILGKFQSDFAWLHPLRPLQVAFLLAGVIILVFALVMQFLRRRYRIPRSLEEASPEQKSASDNNQSQGSA